MQNVILVFFLLLALAAAVSFGVFYWQFVTWPAYLWSKRVRRRADELAARRQELSANDPDAADRQAKRLAADLFLSHLRSIPVETLIGQPGIGPGTVDRVRNGGGRTLADVQTFRFEDLPGIGPAKGHDLRTAVASLVRDARARFDSGGCPEAQEYQRQLASLRSSEAARTSARQRERKAVEAAEAAVAELAAVARDVTFWNFLFHRDVPGLNDKLMDRPLPVVEVPLPVTSPAPPVQVASRVVKPPTVPTPALAPAPSEHPFLPKLRAYARFAFVVAKADGRIAQAERKAIRGFLDEKFGHDTVLARHIDPLIERTESDVPTEVDAVAGVKAVTTDDERRELLAFAGRVADASGERNARERDLLTRVASALGLEIAEQQRVPPVVPSPPAGGATKPQPLPDPRSVLDIEPGVELTPDLIRRRYTLLTEKLDPAKAAAMGPEFARMAGEKRATVRAAAETLIARFGVPLDPPTAPPPPSDLRHNPDLDDVFGG